MSLLSVCNDVAAVVGVRRFTSIFSQISNNRTQQEFLACANEMALAIAHNTRDWRALIVQASFTGDGASQSFAMPANYKRMLKTTNVWRSTTAVYPMRFIPDADEWFNRRALNYNDQRGEWIILAGNMLIVPTMGGPISPSAPPWRLHTSYGIGAKAEDIADHTFWQAAVAHTSASSGTFADDRAANPTFWFAIVRPAEPITPATTAYFTYIDKNCINLASGGVGEEFLNDADTFRLPERLLKLGMIWKWKALKGSPYAEDLGNYEVAEAYEEGSDSPSPTIIGRLPASDTRRVAFPWPPDWGP